METILIDDDHIDEMVQIWNENRDVLSDQNETDKTVDREFLINWKEKEPIEFYGVIVDEDINDELGGFFVLREADNGIILEQMAINDKYKRRSVGNAIIRYCKYQAKDKYDNNLKLHVYAHNTGGINFFFATGFQIKEFDKDKQEYTMVLKD